MILEDGIRKRIYPPRVILGVMRAALLALAIILTFVGITVNSIALLSEGWHRVPFFASAVLAMVWAVLVAHPSVVAWCSTLLFIGFTLRGMEMAVWGPPGVRLVAGATWTLLAIWSFLLGVINQVTVSQKRAGELWGFLAPPNR